MWYPIEVSVSQPALTVQPMVTQLRPGETGTVVLEIRNSTTRELVEAEVTVNGQRYEAAGGRLALPVRPTGPEVLLQVEIDRPDFQYFREEIRLAVLSSWSAHPSGVDDSAELSTWRRKVESLFP